MGAVLEVESVTKFYRRFKVLDEVSMRVYKGQVFGIVGPNGAGKTTLLKVSLGISRRDSGYVLLMGRDPLYDPTAREGVGVVFERPNLPTSLPVRDFLKVAARIYGVGVEAVDEVIGLAGLRGHEGKTFSMLSAGLKQRAALAHALLSDPEVIIADEPTSNLDPVERMRILSLISELNGKKGITFIVTSHVLSEVLRVSSWIAVLNRGRVSLVGPVEKVLERRYARIRTGRPEELSAFLAERGYHCEVRGLSVVVETRGRVSRLLADLSSAEASGIDILGVDLVEPVVEEVLMS